jgi:hypothetical protein
MMQKPTSTIDGLSPAISIEQKTTSAPGRRHGARSRLPALLFARGVPYSPATGLPIESQTVSQMVDRVLALPEGTRIYLLSPIARGRKGEFRKELAELQKKGFQRVKVDGTFYEIADAPKLDKKYKHDIDVVVDRLVVRADIATRLADSFETALGLSDGIAVAELADKPDSWPGKESPPPVLAKPSSAWTRGRVREGGVHDIDGGAPPPPQPSPSRGGKGGVLATKTRRTSASCSRRALPAPSPASPLRKSSRACSPSTRLPAPAPHATA